MTTFTETITERFHVVSCYTCGVRFGVGAELYKRAVTDAKGSLYCPACSQGTCWRESDDQKRIKHLEQKLQWEIENAARQKAAKERAEASLTATRGVVTKLNKRVSAGVCPCCSRTFRQLAQHMAHQHPEFVKENKA